MEDMDIPGTHVKIDDILSKAATMEEVHSIFRKVLIHCREKNIKLQGTNSSSAWKLTSPAPILEARTATDQPLPR